MLKNSKIYVAGHRGLVGSAIVRALQKQGYRNLLARRRDELDLTDQKQTTDFFANEKPEYVFLAAAKVGGILANDTYPADFVRENLAIQNNVIHEAYTVGVKKLLFLGSSCVYPKNSPQPIREEYLLTGPLEKTNKAYAIAKIAGIIMCQAYHKQYGCNFICAMPTNTYGPNDNFDPETSHVFPGLIRKFHDASKNHEKKVTLWGDGTPKREFIHVDDLASACVFLMNHYESPEIINVGTGEDIAISEFAEMVKKIVGFDGTVAWDANKPNGTLQKVLDVSKLRALKFRHEISLVEGIKKTYGWYLENRA